MSKSTKKTKKVSAKSTKHTKKHTDLKPFLAYFKLLSANVKLGFLQMDVAKHEAYVTQPAIHAMSAGSDPETQVKDGSLIRTAFLIRDYAGWLSAEGQNYLRQNFAVHVVKPDEPHDLIYTFILSRKLRFFKWEDKVDVVTYPKK